MFPVGCFSNPRRTLSGLRGLCLPNGWSAPSISADGTVYVGNEESLWGQAKVEGKRFKKDAWIAKLLDLLVTVAVFWVKVDGKKQQLAIQANQQPGLLLLGPKWTARCPRRPCHPLMDGRRAPAIGQAQTPERTLLGFEKKPRKHRSLF